MTDFEEDFQPLPPPGVDAPAQNSDLMARFEAAAAVRLARPDPHGHLLPDRLCQAVVDVVDVQGAALSVYLGADVAIPVGASDLDATSGEALQYTAREGPCFSSYAQHRPVLVFDLDRRDSVAWTDWPTYAEQLTRHTPYRAVFAYPLLRNGIATGSLSLYRTSPGRPADLADLTDLAAGIVDHLVEAELVTDDDGKPEHQWLNGPTALRRRRVWLAQALTLQANHVTPGQALDLLRAQAFSADRLLDDLAEDIVAGRVPAPVLESRP